MEQKHPIMTPVLDSIAGAGARFEKCYSSCPTCIAARRSILSGQYPGSHKMVGYQEQVYWNVDEKNTLPRALRDAGYQTYFVGRDMHQHPKRRRFGYDHMVILDDYKKWLADSLPEISTSSTGAHSGSVYHETGIKHNDWTARPWPFQEHYHSTNWTVNEAKNFFPRRDPTMPWFLTVSFIAPHPPLIPPQFYYDRYIRMGVKDPAIGNWAKPPANKGYGLDPGITDVELQGEQLLSARAGYYGLINHLDDQLRRLINPIDGISLLNDENSGELVNGRDRDTIVIFTSDHGEMLGDHYHWHKMLPYEGAARVPLLISAPEEYGIKNNTVINELVSLEDIMPTILEMTCTEIPDTVEGKSLLPLMQGKTEKIHDYLHIEHAPLHHSITDGQYKYIWFVRDGEEQFFDLEEDPDELNNAVHMEQYEDKVKTFRNQLIQELKNRSEGFSNGKELIPGKIYNPVLKGQ